MRIFLSCFFLTVSSITFATEAKPIGYRVTDPQKTLIQMARDIYKDERLWKKIAQWNKINPPYVIHKGQILVLVDEPVIPLPKANFVLGAEVPSPYFQMRRHVEQKLVTSKKKTVYIVNERAPSLWMVGRELYGNQKMGAVIAKWNGLPKNAKLALDQKLQLKIKPTLDVKLGTKKLIDVWSGLGNVEMVVRLGGRADSVVVKNKTSKPRPVPLEAPPELIEAAAAAPVAPTAAPEPLVKPAPQPAAAAVTAAPEVKVTPAIAPQEDPELAAVQKPQPSVVVPATPVAVPSVQVAPVAQAPATPLQQPALETPPTEKTQATQPEVTQPPREPAAAYVNPDEGLEPKDDSYWLGEQANTILKTISNQVIQEKK